MWFFKAPEIVYGQDALSYLAQIQGHRAFIVTDPTLLQLGFVARVKEQLAQAGLDSEVWAAVEPEPSLDSVRSGATALAAFAPDWVIGLGGGSAIDAAKAMWVLYERPDLDPAEINPILPLGLRARAKLIAIPTTSGTGSEATWATVLTETEPPRKLGLASREIVPDLAIVDPALVANLPRQITADTGIDVLAHALEAYTCTWHNDFSDGLALKAIDLVFRYLPRAVARGAADAEGRERMHNAATIAGLAMGNAGVALAHALGHSLGALFHVPHGRAVGTYLPYAVEYSGRGEQTTRYAEVARFLGLAADGEREAVARLVEAIRSLERQVGLPLSVQDLGIAATEHEKAVARLVELAENDTQIITSVRIPNRADLARLFRYAYAGQSVDF